MIKDAVENGGAVVAVSFLFEYEYAWGKWYRSQRVSEGSLKFRSYMMNRKWTLKEEFNNHMLRFQQVIIHNA